MIYAITSCISCCLPRQMSSERRGEALSEKQAITPARYDEGTITTNHNAATGERGYHNIDKINSVRMSAIQVVTHML